MMHSYAYRRLPAVWPLSPIPPWRHCSHEAVDAMLAPVLSLSVTLFENYSVAGMRLLTQRSHILLTGNRKESTKKGAFDRMKANLRYLDFQSNELPRSSLMHPYVSLTAAL